MNFLNGGAGINVFCGQNNIQIKVVDSGVGFDFRRILSMINAKIAYGTKNFLTEPAMSAEQCELAINQGAEIVQQVQSNGCNIVGFGEMGIGNTLPSAAVILNQLTNLPLETCTGRGTGLDDKGLAKKREILNRAISNHKVTDKGYCEYPFYIRGL